MSSLKPAKHSTGRSRDEQSPRDVSLAVAVLIAIAVTWFVYVPFADRPLDVLDFPEFLPLLRKNPTFLTQLKALVLYYSQDQGRLNVIPYFFIVAKWSLFGLHIPLWQTARFIEMWLIVAGVYFVLRELGISRTGSIWGAALFMFAPPAMVAWARLSIAEPLGILLLLLATHLAAGYQADDHWRARAAGIVLALLAIGFTKEMLLVAVPFVLAVACALGPSGRFEPIKASRRNLFLLRLAFGVLSVAALAIAWVALHAHSDALGQQYGKAAITIDRILTPFLFFVLPGYSLILPALPRLLVLADFVFFAIIIIGWRLAFILSGRGSDIGKRLGISLLLLLPGALVYIPWIGIQTTYGLPFLLSPAFLFGSALTSVERYSKRGSVFVQALAILLIASLAVSAHRFARQYLALQQVNAEVAARIGLSSGQDSTLVAVARKPNLAWVGPGPALARYVLATTGQAIRRPVRDITCAELPSALQANSTLLLVSYHFRCGSLSHPTVSVRRYFPYLDLSTLTPRVDSVRADLLLTRPEASGGTIHNPSSPRMTSKR